jgi:uncharacterized membrane protein (DUF106 family)
MADAPAGPGGAGQPPMPDMSNMWRMMIIMILIFGLYFIDGNDHIIGGALNVVFQIIDFGGEYPVVTLMLMGSIMILLSSVIRTLMMDSLEQQKAQAFSSAFNKELRQARLDNNLYKVKKLMELQPVMMQKSMESSNQMMKSMPVTMLIVVPIFLWVRYFVDVTLGNAGMQIISVPWAMNAINLTDVYWFLPAWILVYSLISIPLGQIIMRTVRAFQFKRYLNKMESNTEEVA